jgi:hypothetical protein
LGRAARRSGGHARAVKDSLHALGVDRRDAELGRPRRRDVAQALALGLQRLAASQRGLLMRVRDEATVLALALDVESEGALAAVEQKPSFEASKAYFEKLAGEPDKFVVLTTEYAKSAQDTFVTGATKIGKLYKTFALEAFTSFPSSFLPK